jgi:hypothetical protein
MLDQQGDQITTTENVVIAAAGNEWNGKEVMTFYLFRFTPLGFLAIRSI